MTIMLNYQQSSTDSEAFEILVEDYPKLGVDVTMAMKRRGQLNVHEYTCSNTTPWKLKQTVPANRLKERCAPRESVSYVGVNLI
jgi:hypothetical protein